MAQALGLGSRAAFLGSQVRVAPYIATFDVAVLSSCDHEGCSNFLLEAMGLGRPVVATSVGGNSELVAAGETGLLVPPANPQALAEAIICLLQDAPLARRLAEAGRQRFRSDFSLDKMVGSYEELYRALWERKRAGSLPAYVRPSPTSRPGVRDP
jgi:glycosyltransferase involved in cell wall biosynthesis